MDPSDPNLLRDHVEVHGTETAGPQVNGSLEAPAEGKRRRRRRRRSTVRNLVEWAIVLAAALGVALIVKTWLFQAFFIPSASMSPTLQEGDRVLVNKISYDLGDVRRGHIIVFERPDDWNTGPIDDLIKRVIGLPGDTIAARDGLVYVNGELLDEPWLAERDRGLTRFEPSSGCVPSCRLGPDELFVLGDNRDNSSASNVYGPISFDDVVGRAFVRVWPLDDIGGL